MIERKKKEMLKRIGRKSGIECPLLGKRGKGRERSQRCFLNIAVTIPQNLEGKFMLYSSKS